MESELSLIEMGGVDDDLLVEDLIGDEKSKSTTATTTTTTLLDLDLDDSIIDFTCSPLVIDRSKRSADRPRIPRPEVKGKGEMQKSCFASPRWVTNKENHNENSVGSISSPDSSHTMKKRKKRGGFNLRKSIAWNKAFFTEEGVLDPLELSRLSHCISKPNGEFLSVVPEEGRTTMIKGSRVCGSGSPLQKLEEDMSSELHLKSVNENKRSVKNMSPVTLPSIRENVSSASSASRKLQLTKSPYKSVSSGGGCPRPSGSSSQKRLPNASALSSTMKESKLPRRTVLKPESSSISATSKHTVAGAKHFNQKTPTANTEKNVGLKGSLNKTKTAPGLTSSFSKSSALHLGKNMGSKGSSSGLKQTADPVRRADTHIPTEDSGRKVPDSVPQNVHSVSRNIPVQSQPTKPSGLRMPSPSIGYFGQPKTSASHSIQSLRNTQSSNVRESGIPNPRKLSHSKQIGATLTGTSRLTKGSTDTKVGANSLSSISKCLIPSIAATTSRPPLKSKIQLKNPEVEAKASNCKSVYNQTNSQPELHSMHDIQSGKQEVARNNAHDEGKMIFQENRKLGVNDTSLRVHSNSFEQLQESNLENIMDVSQKTENISGSELGSEHVPVSLNSKTQVEGVVLADNMIEHNHKEMIQLESSNSNMLIGDHNVISNVKFCDDNGVDTSLVHVESLRDADRVNEISRELLEVRKPGPEFSSQNFTFDIEQIQNEEDTRLQISESILVEDQVISEECQDNDSSVDTSMVHAESLGFSAHHVNEKCGELAVAVRPVSIEVGGIQHKENERLQIFDLTLMKQGGFSEETQKDSDNSGVTTSLVHVESSEFAHFVDEELGEIQHKENKRLQISDIILMEQGVVSEEAQKDNDNSGVTTSVVQVESLGFAHFNDESGELAEAAKLESDEVEQIQHMNQRLHLPDSVFVEQRRLSEESQEDNDNIIATHEGTLMVHVESFGFAHHVNEKSGVLAEVVVRPGSDEQIQHIENQRLLLPDSTLVEQRGLSEESQEDKNNSVIGTSVEHVENLGFAHHVNEESGELAEVVKSGSDEVEQVQHLENLQLHLPDSIVVVQQGLSEESHDDNDNTAVGTCVDTSMVHVETLGFSHHANVKSGDLSEAVMSGSNDVEQIQHMQNQQLQLSDRISVEQCVSSEEIQKDNFLENDTFVSESGCWMGTSDILFRVAPVMQLNEGIAIVDNMKNNQQAGCFQFERQDKDSSENRDSISGTEISDLIDSHNHAHCSRAVDDVDEPATKQIRLREKYPPHEIKEILPNGDNSFELNDKTLLLRSRSTKELQKDDHNTLVLQSRSSGESQEDNDIGNVIYVSPKTSNSGGNSCKKSHVLSHLELHRKVKEGDAGNDNTIEHHAVENHESLYDTPCEYPIDDSAEDTLGFISCVELSKQTSDTTTCNLEFVSSPLSISTSSGNTPDHIDDTASQNDISLHKTETNLSPSIEIPDGEQCESENAVSPMKCTDPTLSVKRSSPGYSNHDALTLKYKIKAVPFSDEWLAALEAAGEDILTMKSGAVQNSPTDKSLPEPSPWSPVKRKNQEIGPFDCTKCTNVTPPNIP